MVTDRCPHCGNGAVVSGALEDKVVFFLSGGRAWLKRLLGRAGLHVLELPTRAWFLGCTACGLVWGSLSPGELRTDLSQQGVLHEKGDDGADLGRWSKNGPSGLRRSTFQGRWDSKFDGALLTQGREAATCTTSAC